MASRGRAAGDVQPPEEVRILGRRYSVTVIPDSGLDARNRGSITHRTAKIEILGGMCEEATRETLLHETIHAIENGLHLEFSEQQVHAFSIAFYAVAQESPEAMRWMLRL